tara:strand:+ start:811 stop:1059 length:249 start_codon:yes stop_codon:yes gene_type:complete
MNRRDFFRRAGLCVGAVVAAVVLPAEKLYPALKYKVMPHHWVAPKWRHFENLSPVEDPFGELKNMQWRRLPDNTLELAVLEE